MRLGIAVTAVGILIPTLAVWWPTRKVRPPVADRQDVR